MGTRITWRWVPMRGLGFAQMPVVQHTCDLCGKDTFEGETNACKRCRDNFAAIAEQIWAATGVRFTPDMIKSIGRGPRPPQFRYGKPWHRHIPPREREKLGLHT